MYRGSLGKEMESTCLKREGKEKGKKKETE